MGWALWFWSAYLTPESPVYVWRVDPSYVRQLLVVTYPMIGNYGVPDTNELDEHGISKFFESYKIHAGALIVDDLTENYRCVCGVGGLVCSSA